MHGLRWNCPPFTAHNINCPCKYACAWKSPGAQIIAAYLCPSAPRNTNPFINMGAKAMPGLAMPRVHSYLRKACWRLRQTTFRTVATMRALRCSRCNWYSTIAFRRRAASARSICMNSITALTASRMARRPQSWSPSWPAVPTGGLAAANEAVKFPGVRLRRPYAGDQLGRVLGVLRKCLHGHGWLELLRYSQDRAEGSARFA